jgi:hypothetical protein
MVDPSNDGTLTEEEIKDCDIKFDLGLDVLGRKYLVQAIRRETILDALNVNEMTRKSITNIKRTDLKDFTTRHRSSVIGVTSVNPMADPISATSVFSTSARDVAARNAASRVINQLFRERKLKDDETVDISDVAQALENEPVKASDFLLHLDKAVHDYFINKLVVSIIVLMFMVRGRLPLQRVYLWYTCFLLLLNNSPLSSLSCSSQVHPTVSNKVFMIFTCEGKECFND